MTFKEIQQTKWPKKYGNFDWEDQRPRAMSTTLEQRILELEAKVKLLEKSMRKTSWLNGEDKKVIIFDMLVDMAEKNMIFR